MKKRLFLASLVLIFILSGCGEKKERVSKNTDKKINITENTEPIKEEKKEEKKEITQAVTEPVKEEEKEKIYSNYKDAYREIVKEAVDNEGVSGKLKYGTLMDLEKDNVPELLLVKSGKGVYAELSVYKFGENKCTKIYVKPLGSRMGQTDISYSFGMNETMSTPCLVTFQSEAEWTTECMHVFYLDAGETKEKILLGRSDVPIDDASFNWEDPFDYFEIDGKEVEKNTFYDSYNEICEGLTEVDVVCNQELGYEGHYDQTNKMVYFTEEARNKFFSILDL